MLVDELVIKQFLVYQNELLENISKLQDNQQLIFITEQQIAILRTFLESESWINNYSQYPFFYEQNFIQQQSLSSKSGCPLDPAFSKIVAKQNSANENPIANKSIPIAENASFNVEPNFKKNSIFKSGFFNIKKTPANNIASESSQVINTTFINQGNNNNTTPAILTGKRKRKEISDDGAQTNISENEQELLKTISELIRKRAFLQKQINSKKGQDESVILYKPGALFDFEIISGAEKIELLKARRNLSRINTNQTINSSRVLAENTKLRNENLLLKQELEHLRSQSEEVSPSNHKFY